MAKSSSNLVHSHPSRILCLTPCAKARKSFHCVVVMYFQTNLPYLGCKSFSIFYDLVEMSVALTLNIAKWYFCMLHCLMMMHQTVQKMSVPESAGASDCSGWVEFSLMMSNLIQTSMWHFAKKLCSVNTSGEWKTSIPFRTLHAGKRQTALLTGTIVIMWWESCCCQWSFWSTKG